MALGGARRLLGCRRGRDKTLVVLAADSFGTLFAA